MSEPLQDKPGNGGEACRRFRASRLKDGVVRLRRQCTLSIVFGMRFRLHTAAAYYRKRGSASYIVREVLSVRERDTDRERDRDGSDVTIVALKLAMNSHFPLPKIRNWR